VPDLLRRLGALVTASGRERRTVFVHSDDPWYELYYDGQARPVFEYRNLDGRAIQRFLTSDQEKEFGRRGPAYIAELYRATAAGRARGEAPVFDPAVEQRLRDDYPEVTRWIAVKHLATYVAGRPHHVRVQLAVLGIARGNVHALEKWIGRAEIDFRWPLREVGDSDAARPLPPGETGIDPATGAIVADEGTIEPSVPRAEFRASRLFKGESWSPREAGEEILAGVPLTLDGVVFTPALRFDDQRLTEVWLERPEGADVREWLDSRLPGWGGAFAWGTVDVEGDVGSAIVVRFAAPATGDPKEAP
jgi:hypothetical protein